ncbi:MAG: hypothetical protein FJX02_04480 [Alphaproteobacteria bacterium]|nr:hypothetical protein [Alphaproteobacteria bacterium]
MRNRLEGNQQVGAFGFGRHGGRWAVDGSLSTAANGVAVWNARIDRTVRELHTIYELFVVHCSERDPFAGPVIQADLAERVRRAGREPHIFRYRAQPGFYNPRLPEYDKPDATLAWRRSIGLWRKLWMMGWVARLCQAARRPDLPWGLPDPPPPERAPRRCWVALRAVLSSSSSNSEASCSIMVPPSWSASTMVTARR